jgi:hypothetical protein
MPSEQAMLILFIVSGLLWTLFVFVVGFACGRTDLRENVRFCLRHPVPGRDHQYCEHETNRAGRKVCIWCGEQQEPTDAK